MTNIVAVLKFLLFALATLTVILPQIILLNFTDGKRIYVLPQIWHKVVCRIFRIKILIHGKPSIESQTLFIGNHISYLDIPVIGTVLKASFVAKKDVASWPVFGFLANLQRTAFISRDRKDVTKEKNNLETMLNDGKDLIIFAEGTSTDGREVRPFKSSLFSLAFKENLKDLMVQPFTIKMLQTNGKEVLTQENRDYYSWHINMDTSLAEHLWTFSKGSGAIISLEFHEPIKANDFSDRKTLAKACHNTVSKGLENKFNQ